MSMNASTQSTIISAVNNWNSQNPNSYPIDPNVIIAIALTESSGQQYTNGSITQHVNSDGSIDYGVMQLNNSTFPNAASLSEADNIAAGVGYYGTQLQNAGGDVGTAIQAYNTGSVNKPAPGYLASVQANGANVVSGNLSPTLSSYSPLANNAANAATVTPLIVIQQGLDVKPWYADKGLYTGNVRLRQEVQPVTFQVLLHDNNYFLLSTQGETGVPIQVQLNASMKSVSWSMKHIYHHQRTRTAHHVTMWGMQADIIEGQCTTGVFMNQFGLTDYYSTRTVNDNLKSLVTSGAIFSSSQLANHTVYKTSNPNVPPNPNPNPGPGAGMILGSDGKYYPASAVSSNGIIDNPINTTTNPTNSNYQNVMNAKNISTSNQAGAFRVAAQDAFMEFLALFKMNGSVWFWNQLYKINVGVNRDWTQIEAWSPVLGLSASQANSRNNDVVTRGGIIMSYRNFTYQGYFKSLQWTMDAQNPFQWNFSFVFQVEKTLGQQFIPNTSGSNTQASNNSSNNLPAGNVTTVIRDADGNIIPN